MTDRISPAALRVVVGGLLVAVVVVAIIIVLSATSGSGSGYRVRAIFDSASFLVPGEDVKVAGVKVGAIESLDVTPDNKAAIVLRIDDPAFQDFKQDAFCTIRLQSLIGEKFVACQPTQPKGANTAPAASLQKITRGPGTGQYLLPVTNTSAPVDIDLLSNIMRLPERQRFAIILNELGVGLAGNGQQLNQVIRRADPAIYQFDRVLAILASQNRVLANLARDSDAALAPVAAQSQSISDFIDKAGATAAASAARGDAIEQNFAKLPAFLTQLRPTVRRLGEFATAGTPVMRDLRAAAPSIDTFFAQLGPFSTAALPTFRTLGNLADVGRQALPAAAPVIHDIRAFADRAKPLAAVLAPALTNLEAQHGIERLLDVILETTGTANGFDSVSHYLRTYLATVPFACLAYAVVQDPNCVPATFNQGGNATAATTATAALDAAAASAGSGSVSPVDAPAQTAPVVPPAPSGAPTDSGLLNYLLSGSGSR